MLEIASPLLLTRGLLMTSQVTADLLKEQFRRKQRDLKDSQLHLHKSVCLSVWGQVLTRQTHKNSRCVCGEQLPGLLAGHPLLCTCIVLRHKTVDLVLYLKLKATYEQLKYVVIGKESIYLLKEKKERSQFKLCLITDVKLLRQAKHKQSLCRSESQGHGRLHPGWTISIHRTLYLLRLAKGQDRGASARQRRTKRQNRRRLKPTVSLCTFLRLKKMKGCAREEG